MTAVVHALPGERLELTEHRLLPLRGNDLAVLAERHNGWCILTRDEYAFLTEYLKTGERRFTDLRQEERAPVEALWSAGLLLAGGQPHPEAIPPTQSYPSALLLKLTGACNFECSYCYDYDEKRFKSGLKLSQIEELLAALLAKQKELSIVFHGGEPMLRFRLIVDVVASAKRIAKSTGASISFSVQTNATRFTKEAVEFLEKNDFSVGISLDGSTEQHNALRLVRRGPSALEIARRLMDDYPEFVRERCGFLAVVSKTSIGGIPAFATWLQARGIGGFSLSFLDNVGRAAGLTSEKVSPDDAVELYAALVDLIRRGAVSSLALKSITSRIRNLFTFYSKDLCHKGPCGAGSEFLVLDSVGDLRTCDCVYHPFFEIHPDAGVDLVPAAALVPARRAVTERVEWLRSRGTTCSSCPLFSLCGGTCVAKAIGHHGTPLSVDPVECAISKYLYPEVLQEFVDQGPSEGTLIDYYMKHRSVSYSLMAMS